MGGEPPSESFAIGRKAEVGEGLDMLDVVFLTGEITMLENMDDGTIEEVVADRSTPELRRGGREKK